VAIGDAARIRGVVAKYGPMEQMRLTDEEFSGPWAASGDEVRP
jgi:hypothetical protein